MPGWSEHVGTAVALPRDNIDTDQLIPARFMSTPRAQGYGNFLLHDLRRDAHDALDETFPLNTCPDASILVAGRNFGSGSSREAAVYALLDAGFRVVIAPSFGDIFAANAVNNGLLPAQVTPEVAADLAELLASGPREMTVTLEPREVLCGATRESFDVKDGWRTKLINGWDDIDLTLDHAARIAAFRDDRRSAAPWAWPRRPGAQYAR